MIIRQILITVVLLCGWAFCTFAESLPDNLVILPEQQGESALAQCSRATPGGITGFWTPSVRQVLEVEKRLPELLIASGHNIRLSDSRRQYVGVIRGDSHLIYINAFPAVEPREKWDRGWRSRAFTVCDGGPQFWGLLFNPANPTFLFIDFNGVG